MADYKENILKTLSLQRDFFASHKTKSYEFRIEQLSKLRSLIVQYEQRILDALAKDLGKHAIDGYLAEVGFVLGEIDFTLARLHRWMKPRKVPGPWVQYPSRNYIQPTPYGNVLIIAPWNYPFQLSVGVALGAICAGNTAIIKPSELAPETSRVVAEMINKNFDPGYLHVVEGGIAETSYLLDMKFQYIFYTGSTQIGKIVMQKAAVNLTPVTLELGGKSPCLVFGDQDLNVTARRIAWGKFINAGQTCVAPDYILVEKRLENDFVKSLSKAVVELYTQDPLSSPYYGRIVNQKHFDRLKNLIEPGKVISGGQMVPAKMQIAPTILKEDGTSKAMQDEIFGPILPVMTADSVAQAISIVNSMEKPLALYVFSQDQELIENVLTKTNSGGVCINDCIVHMSTPYLPFGGVGSSGMGAYHGVFSFETFSHKRSVMVRSLWPDLILRYPPYKLALKWFKILLRYMSH